MTEERKNGIVILGREACETIYGAETLAAIAERIRLVAPPFTREEVAAHAAGLAETEVLFSGWGAPVLDAAFLAAAPRLKVLLYGAGSVRGIVTDAAWDRGLLVSTAVSVNAVPVAEYALAAILFGLKRAWQHERAYRAGTRVPFPTPGACGGVVGLVSLGAVGRLVRERLRPFDVRVLAYDPFLDDAAAAAFGVERATLDDLFRRADVVSLHTPNLPETQGLVTGAHLESMKPGAVLVNTARGAVVREAEMAAVLGRRADLQAVLDVTVHETREADDPLLRLPNVTRTPHIAGSMGSECRRMGRFMLEELDRCLRGEPLRGGITRIQASRMA